MQFRILGPLEVEGASALGGKRPRALLRTLLLAANQVVSADRLIDAVWGEEPPETARHALQVHLSTLRKAVPGGRERVLTEAGGYRIAVAEDELDALRFERLVERGRALLASGEAGSAAVTLDEALRLWRGPMEGSTGEEARLEALRLTAQEERVEAELRRGRHAEVVPELERLIAEHPLRERLRGQLMLALYGSGRQADALAVYAATRAKLVEDLGLEPGPELRELEAAILRQDPALLASPRPAAAVRLPAPPTPLVGRRREIEALCALLDGEARLVTVTGPGGTGKSRVALETARQLSARFADGAVFVALAALREPELVGIAIADALGFEPGPRDTASALIDHLAGRSLLLLLDNFEQVDDAAPLLGELLTAAAGLKLLVTSRRSLRIYGEFDYPLPPLRLREEAVPLFVARARAAGAALEPDEAVAGVCEALDCLPLAIELAAARSRRLAPAEMLAALPSRLELAGEGPRDAPDRHRALHAAIAWSHDLLPDRLQTLFSELAVFAGGWDAEAARAVTGAEPHELHELVAHSLVHAAGDRFAQLETIREFAALALVASGREERARDRHAAHYAQLAAHAERQLRQGGDQTEWLGRLERDHDNLRAALSRLGETDPAAELAMAGALAPFWAVRGHAAEGLDRLRRALGRSPAPDSLPHAHAVAGAAGLAWVRGEHDASRRLSEQALALYRVHGDAAGLVRALANLGYVALQGGRTDEARAYYEEGLAVARSADSPRAVTVALNCLSELELETRDLESARSVGEQSLALSRQIGDQESTGVALLNLGFVALHQDRPDEARELLREAAGVFMGLGDLEVVAHACNGLAATLAGRPEIAARLLGAAAALREAVGAAIDFEPRVRDRALEAARADLGTDFEAAYAAGRELTPEQAIALSGP